MGIISADEAKNIFEFYNKRAINNHLELVEEFIISASKDRRTRISVNKSAEYDNSFWEQVINIWKTLGYGVEETPTLYRLFW